MMQKLRYGIVAAMVATAALVLAGCAGGAPAPVESASVTPVAPQTPSRQSPPNAPPPPEHASVGMVATVKGERITPLDSPDGDAVETFTNPARHGVPLVFLVVDAKDDWLEVKLPMRPNGTTGWVESAEVALHSLSYALEVSVDDRVVVLTKDGAEVKRFDAAVGTGDTPTPTGDFYITELLKPTNDGYGPYAFGVSAFSEVLNSFGGGPGQIGLHGTPDADSIGQAVSHGCIRLHNDDITYLASILPLGTPITIG